MRLGIWVVRIKYVGLKDKAKYGIGKKSCLGMPRNCVAINVGEPLNRLTEYGVLV